MRIPRRLYNELRDHASAGYPVEVCGVLMGKREWDGVPCEPMVEFVMPQRNIAIEDHRSHFAIDSYELVELHRTMRDLDRQILGYYHSHPNGIAVPSEIDRRIAAAGMSDGVIHVIVSVNELGVVVADAWVFRQEQSIFERERVELTD